MDKDFLNQEDYKYGFHDEDTSLYKTEKGLTRETVMEISRIKKEPQWMLEYRLKAFEQFEKWKSKIGDQIYMILTLMIIHIM